MRTLITYIQAVHTIHMYIYAVHIYYTEYVKDTYSFNVVCQSVLLFLLLFSIDNQTGLVVLLAPFLSTKETVHTSNDNLS